MKNPQVVVLESDGWLADQVRRLAADHAWLVRESRRPEACLALPRPAYLIVPEDDWYDPRAPQITTPVRVIARRYDFYAQKYILVVANRYAAPD